VLEKEARIIEKGKTGCLIEICIKGKHHNACGNDLINYIESTVQDLNPTGILLNLSEFKYRGGNDIGPLLFPFLDRQTKVFRPFCIVASGRTARLLQSLFRFVGINEISNAKYFEDAADGLRYLRTIVSANAVKQSREVSKVAQNGKASQKVIPRGIHFCPKCNIKVLLTREGRCPRCHIELPFSI
jgi:hypothetical protein